MCRQSKVGKVRCLLAQISAIELMCTHADADAVRARVQWEHDVQRAARERRPPPPCPAAQVDSAVVDVARHLFAAGGGVLWRRFARPEAGVEDVVVRAFAARVGALFPNKQRATEWWISRQEDLGFRSKRRGESAAAEEKNFGLKVHPFVLKMEALCMSDEFVPVRRMYGCPSGVRYRCLLHDDAP